MVLCIQGKLMEVSTMEAFYQGRRAYWAGYRIVQSPYEDYVLDGAWCDGWEEAEDDDQFDLDA